MREVISSRLALTGAQAKRQDGRQYGIKATSIFQVCVERPLAADFVKLGRCVRPTHVIKRTNNIILN